VTGFMHPSFALDGVDISGVVFCGFVVCHFYITSLVGIDLHDETFRPEVNLVLVTTSQKAECMVEPDFPY
jgi:hypothetical protein